MSRDNVVQFNPLDKRHLGESVGQAMLRQPVSPMSDLKSFNGAGIYAIYYCGDFEAYKVISGSNQNEKFLSPIYVGKAVPKGARKGGDLEVSPGKVLYSRLKQHKKSIEEADNLDITDFYYRFLVVDDIWIPLGESLLIAKFYPIWNVVIDGFGNHDPGSGRHAGLRPRWDVLHPGRAWAERCQVRQETAEYIVREAKTYLEDNPPPDDTSIITT